MTTPPQGLDRLLKQLASITPRQMAISQIALEDATGELAGKIKAACHVPEIAEHVFAQEARPDQVEIQKIKAEWGYVWEVRAITSGQKGHVYSPLWEEFGTKPHSLAKRARRKSGKYQDKGPHHPGAAARPFFYPTIRAERTEVSKTVRGYANKALREVPKG